MNYEDFFFFPEGKFWWRRRFGVCVSSKDYYRGREGMTARETVHKENPVIQVMALSWFQTESRLGPPHIQGLAPLSGHVLRHHNKRRISIFAKGFMSILWGEKVVGLLWLTGRHRGKDFSTGWTRSLQTFSIHCQILNIWGFAGPMVFVRTPVRISHSPQGQDSNEWVWLNSKETIYKNRWWAEFP